MFATTGITLVKNRFIKLKITRKDLLLGIFLLFSNALSFFCSYIIYEKYWQTNEVIGGISAEKYKYACINNIHNFKSTLGKDNLHWTTECNATFNSNDFLLSLDIASGWLIDGRLFPFLIQFSKDNVEDEFFFTLVTCDNFGNMAYEYYDLNQDGEFDAFKDLKNGGEYIDLSGSFIQVDSLDVHNKSQFVAIKGNISHLFVNDVWSAQMILDSSSVPEKLRYPPCKN